MTPEEVELFKLGLSAIVGVVGGLSAGHISGKRSGVSAVSMVKIDGQFGEIKKELVTLRSEMVTRSHNLADKQQASNLAVAVQIKEIEGDLKRAQQDITTMNVETAGEIRRLETLIKEQHVDVKEQLKDIKGMMSDRRQAGLNPGAM